MHTLYCTLVSRRHNTVAVVVVVVWSRDVTAGARTLLVLVGACAAVVACWSGAL